MQTYMIQNTCHTRTYTHTHADLPIQLTYTLIYIILKQTYFEYPQCVVTCINIYICVCSSRFVVIMWKCNLYQIVLFRVGVVFLVLLLSACGGLFRYYYRRWYTEGSGLPYIPFPASPAYSSLPTHISNQEPLFQVP